MADTPFRPYCAVRLPPRQWNQGIPLTLSPAECAARDFKVFLEPDADYGGYVVVCPSIPGCYSQGKTVPEALANIREAIDLCLEDMESTPSW